MPRVSRFVLPNVVHHVVACGVNKQNIFRSAIDRETYLRQFAKVAEEEKVLVHGYCLMQNHVHWLLTPTTPSGLARLFQRVHTWWAVTFNRKYQRTGHLFQSRYHSSPLDEQHYWEALRYVELNPKKARLIKQPEAWQYSSARAHLTGQPDSYFNLVPVQTKRAFSVSDWQLFLGTADHNIEHSLRRATAGCRPWGEASWVAGLEKEHRRRLCQLPSGRPPIQAKSLSADSTLATLN